MLRIIQGIFFCACIWKCLLGNCVGSAEDFKKNMAYQCPKWMQEQIQYDLAPLKKKSVSSQKIYKRFLQEKGINNLIRFQIKSGVIHVKIHPEIDAEGGKIRSYTEALNEINHVVGLPDCTFYIYLGDNYHHYVERKILGDFPVFVMSRMEKEGSHQDLSILVPDYLALLQKFQVLKGKDITQINLPWEDKSNLLVWRGSTTQNTYLPNRNITTHSRLMNDNNACEFSRVRLCQLSSEYPDWIDAKFTITHLEDKNIHTLENLFGEKLSYEDQAGYKFHTLVHGKAASYSHSGWKFFLNSVVFLPSSGWTQWYYSALKPYVHCLPIEEDFSDLMEKLSWARENDFQCKEIAKNAQEFARSNLIRAAHLQYLYHVIVEYSKIDCWTE